MARPSKFQPQIIASILDGLRSGLPRTHAAAAAGISASLFFYWLAHGNDYRVNTEFLDKATHAREPVPFDTAVRLAEALFVSEKVKQLNHFAEGGDWMAAAFLLERRFPSEFSRRAMSDASIGDMQDQIEKLLSGKLNSGVSENPGTDLIIVSGGIEKTNITKLDEIVNLSHRNYLGSYAESDERAAEAQRDTAFGNLLLAFRELKKQVDQMSAAA